MAVHSLNAELVILGSTTTVTDLSMSSITSTLYEVESASSGKNFWDPAASVTIREDVKGANTTVTALTERYLNGQVDFDSAPTTPVEADVDYFSKHAVGKASEVTVEFSNNLADVDQLQDSGKRRRNTKSDLTASFSQFEWGDDYIDAPTNAESRYVNMIKDGTRTGLVIKSDTSKSTVPQIRAIGKLQGDSISVPADGVITGDFQFEASIETKHSSNQASPELWRLKTQAP